MEHISFTSIQSSIYGCLWMFFMEDRRVDTLSSAPRPAENNIPMEVPLDCLSHPFKADLGKNHARIVFLVYVILPMVAVVLFACCLSLLDVSFCLCRPGDPRTGTRGKASFYTDLARHFAELPWISLRRGINNGKIWKMGLSKHRVYYITIWIYMVYLVVHPMASR